jgi:hypothetical protein
MCVRLTSPFDASLQIIVVFSWLSIMDCGSRNCLETNTSWQGGRAVARSATTSRAWSCSLNSFITPVCLCERNVCRGI